MKYLITGINGQLGFDIANELRSRGNNDILALSRKELDITDTIKVNQVISNYQPDVIFHCAAWTAVDKAEDEKLKCFNTNVIGTKNIALAASNIEAKMIYISTDYVFDGEKDGLYEVFDKTNPKSTYGKTKQLGEEIVKTLVKKHFVVRTSWVFGINGNNFVKTMLRLSEGKQELSIVADQFGSPTYTSDLAPLLVDMSDTEKYGVYHANNEGYCNWAEFASYIFKVNDKNVKIHFINSNQYPQKAYRPKNSCLSKRSLIYNGFELLPSWEDAVERYSKQLKKTII